ncbi:MAG: Asp-tRNA(Asn)/Glu-tRNA(Gln) amidotransferase subunit GatB [Betaproteobacteria bacterium]|nr:Asp-tRNA(Asn)/Glu-tRNA(Gln) amidotransferase subunit GatB [Betaproteobacteria bacterium]
MFMKWETVIGIETHAQLSTRSKIFSGASTAFGAAPNTQACAVDIALPGVLPVLNRGAVERAIRFGLAVGGNVNRRSVFARKNYFYPDLPKGYQISQYEIPIVAGGAIAVQVDGTEKSVRLTRAHLEEDAGKSLHEDFHGASGIDLNRAGTPLLEIVSEPDMRSAQEAVAYAKALHALVRWIDICDGNMQEGSFRCDANVSVRPQGSATLGTRCEIKNLNSFRFLERAIEYEVRRQIGILEDGGAIVQETRLYDPDRDETRSLRIKEDAHDYRYFPDPDLLPLAVSEQWVNEVKAALPELPQAKRERFIAEFGVTPYDATLLTANREIADYFATAARDAPGAVVKLCANWITGPISAKLNEGGLDFDPANVRVSAQQLRRLVERIVDRTLNNNTAKQLFEHMWHTLEISVHETVAVSDAIDALIEKHGLKQISDRGEIERIVDQVIAANPQQAADYRGGKEKAFNSLVGQVMKATRGKANPQQVNEVLKRKLSSQGA